MVIDDEGHRRGAMLLGNRRNASTYNRNQYCTETHDYLTYFVRNDARNIDGKLQ